MASKIEVAREDEFTGDGSRVITEVDGREIAVFQHDGEYHALANYCIHQAGPLCEGALTGQTSVGEDGWEWTYDTEEKCIMCPWHGWSFDITTGQSVKDSSYAVPSYTVEAEDGIVYVIR